MFQIDLTELGLLFNLKIMLFVVFISKWVRYFSDFRRFQDVVTAEQTEVVDKEFHRAVSTLCIMDRCREGRGEVSDGDEAEQHICNLKKEQLLLWRKSADVLKAFAVLAPWLKCWDEAGKYFQVFRKEIDSIPQDSSIDLVSFLEYQVIIHHRLYSISSKCIYRPTALQAAEVTFSKTSSI